MLLIGSSGLNQPPSHHDSTCQYNTKRQKESLVICITSILDFIVQINVDERQKEWGIPGFEPGTTRTLSEYHTPRPNPHTTVTPPSYLSQYYVTNKNIPSMNKDMKTKIQNSMTQRRLEPGSIFFIEAELPNRPPRD